MTTTTPAADTAVDAVSPTETVAPTTQAYQELQYAYDYFNEHLFGGELPNTLITLQRGKRTFGYFSPSRFTGKSEVSELAMNPDYLGSRSLFDTLSTLAHEMAHVWRHYSKDKPSRGGYHDTIWANKMEEIGLMPTDTGREGGKRTGQKVTHYIMKDGAFERCVYALLKGGYDISWYDAFGGESIVDTQTSGDIIESWLKEAGDDEELINKLTTTVCKTNPLASVIDPNRREASAAARGMQAALAPASKGKSNRCKYTCGSCGLNAWAKPDVRIGCADCGILLVEQD